MLKLIICLFMIMCLLELFIVNTNYKLVLNLEIFISLFLAHFVVSFSSLCFK